MDTKLVTEGAGPKDFRPPKWFNLSPLHAMLAYLRQQTDAKKLNEIVNHPAVYPHVFDAGMTKGAPMDLSAMVEDPRTIVLMATYGGGAYQCLQPGIYEGHSFCLPKGRGKWALLCAKATLHWMFTKTDAVEIMMRCPKGNLAVHAFSRALGGIYRFTVERGWAKDGRMIPADIFSLTLQDWMTRAPGLEERGRWFSKQLKGELDRAGIKELQHPDDDTHDRFIGAACEMLIAGNPLKAVAFYNRWASLASYVPLYITSADPLTIDVGSMQVEIKGESFRVVKASSRPVH
jgi:hypothetical protein